MKRPLAVAGIVLITIVLMAQTGSVPAYNAGSPSRGTTLPPILTPAQLPGVSGQFPYQKHAYELAAKIPNVLYQQPCYCYCDRMGHNSLRSCYESTHAANCGACLKELYYSYQTYRNGKSARQIREGIIRGEWKQVELESAASIN